MQSFDKAVEFETSRVDYFALLYNIDSELEVVVKEAIELNLEQLEELFSEKFELECLPSAIPTLIAEDKFSTNQKTVEPTVYQFICPKCQNKYLRQSNFKKHEQKCHIEGINYSGFSSEFVSLKLRHDFRGNLNKFFEENLKAALIDEAFGIEVKEFKTPGNNAAELSLCITENTSEKRKNFCTSVFEALLPI
ncbi:uncharacterized protein LOC136079508 [Hydra vulgaris]|uniref:Uncharacterized protein LOC136079508 n=1 Tax=Hydra vulgaris TaxID=6087 RepID=A0ABM4BQB2_HYDVU